MIQCPLAKVHDNKYLMRPICQACGQRPCAVNYIREDVKHYRKRCETCARKNRGIKPREPRWKSAGYKKKMSCDRCGYWCIIRMAILAMPHQKISNQFAKTVWKNCLDLICRGGRGILSRMCDQLLYLGIQIIQ